MNRINQKLKRNRQVSCFQWAKPALWLFVLSLSITSCSSEYENQEGQWSQIPSYPVFEVSKADYTGYNNYPARLVGIQDIEVRAKVGGYIQSIHVDEGQLVKAGQLLFRLEANTVAQNTKANAAAVNTAEARVQSARIEVERLKPLVEKDIISSIELQTAEANLQSAEAQLAQAQSNFRASKANEDYTRIYSPIDGYIGKLNYKKGALVNPSDVLAMTTITNTNAIHAYFSVSETELKRITQNIPGKNLSEKLKAFPPVELKLVDGTKYAVQGVLNATTGKVNPETGAIQLRVLFNNPDGELLSGSSGVVKIPVDYKNKVGIPAISSFEMQGQPMVYLVSEGDTLFPVPIHVLDKVDGYFVLENGLSPGSKVLGMGVGKVYPGTVISPQLTAMDSIANSYQAVFK